MGGKLGYVGCHAPWLRCLGWAPGVPTLGEQRAVEPACCNGRGCDTTTRVAKAADRSDMGVA